MIYRSIDRYRYIRYDRYYTHRYDPCVYIRMILSRSRQKRCRFTKLPHIPVSMSLKSQAEHVHHLNAVITYSFSSEVYIPKADRYGQR